MIIRFSWGEEFKNDASYDLSGFSYDFGTTSPGMRSNMVPEFIHMSVKLAGDGKKKSNGSQFLSIAKDQLAVADQNDKTCGVIRVYRENDTAGKGTKPFYEIKFQEAWVTDIQASLTSSGVLPMEMQVTVQPSVIVAHGVTLKTPKNEM